jgi:hypothetical protein
MSTSRDKSAADTSASQRKKKPVWADDEGHVLLKEWASLTGLAMVECASRLVIDTLSPELEADTPATDFSTLVDRLPLQAAPARTVVPTPEPPRAPAPSRAPRVDVEDPPPVPTVAAPARTPAPMEAADPTATPAAAAPPAAPAPPRPAPRPARRAESDGPARHVGGIWLV